MNVFFLSLPCKEINPVNMLIRHLILSLILISYLPQIYAKVPVYIVAGQSNTDGRGSMTEMPEKVRKYVSEGGTNDILMSYCNGTTKKELGKFAPYVPMYEGNSSERCGFDAILYSKMASDTSDPFYVIKESKGGTAIDTICSSSGYLFWNAEKLWLEQAGIANYDVASKVTYGKSLLLQLEANIDSCINTTLSTLPDGYEFKCIIWHQGESDRKQGEAYYNNLRTLVEHLRNHIALTTGDNSYRNLPFIAGGVNKESHQYNEAVERAKKRLAEADPNFHYINLDGCSLREDDRLHFNGAGCLEAATRFFNYMDLHNLLPNSVPQKQTE